VADLRAVEVVLPVAEPDLPTVEPGLTAELHHQKAEPIAARQLGNKVGGRQLRAVPETKAGLTTLLDRALVAAIRAAGC